MQDNKQEPKKPKRKAIILNFGNRVFKNFFANALFYFVLNSALVFSLIGYTIDWVIVDNAVTTQLFILVFTLIEIVVRQLVHKLIPSIMIYSFGSVGLFITVISMFAADQLLSGFSFKNPTTLVFFILILVSSRFVIYTILLRKKISKILDNQSKSQKK